MKSLFCECYLCGPKKVGQALIELNDDGTLSIDTGFQDKSFHEMKLGKNAKRILLAWLTEEDFDD